MSRKSTTCTGKQSGQPLTEYFSAEEAHEAAVFVEANYGRAMTPYRCQRCREWHLALASRHTPSAQCYDCVGRNGKPKQTYRSEREARCRAEILRRERGVSLSVYQCPNSDGWHLTKG